MSLTHTQRRVWLTEKSCFFFFFSPVILFKILFGNSGDVTKTIARLNRCILSLTLLYTDLGFTLKQLKNALHFKHVSCLEIACMHNYLQFFIFHLKICLYLFNNSVINIHLTADPVHSCLKNTQNQTTNKNPPALYAIVIFTKVCVLLQLRHLFLC